MKMNTQKQPPAKLAPNPLAPPAFSVRRPASVGDGKRQAVVLCRDASTSMRGGKDQEASEAARRLVEELAQTFNRDAFDAAVVDFNDQAATAHRLLRTSQLLPRLSPIQTGGGGTDIASALAAADALLRQPMPGEGTYIRPVALLFTDGIHNTGADPRPAAASLKTIADLVTVAFGSDADETLLTELATSPSHFYRCTDGAQLRVFLAQVGMTLSTTRARGTEATRALGEIKP
jgi:uncharacterized protein YegL